ncbi:hypothetical protein DL93DRAFT_2075657 [Clavulina sp. PMI_390]|nr:hypothetical protein DL93DRAFT_2075657 [Clavulina sp. PMI_390]
MTHPSMGASMGAGPGVRKYGNGGASSARYHHPGMVFPPMFPSTRHPAFGPYDAQVQEVDEEREAREAARRRYGRRRGRSFNGHDQSGFKVEEIEDEVFNDIGNELDPPIFPSDSASQYGGDDDDDYNTPAPGALVPFHNGNSRR